MANDWEDNLQDPFRKMTKDIKGILDRNMGKVRDKSTLDRVQKEQVELLMELEDRFKNTIIRRTPSRTEKAYRKFIAKITVENRNILTARPYFREQAKNFSTYVTPALKDGNWKELQKYHINFNFIKYIRKVWPGSFSKDSEALYREVEKTRKELIENNLPLAINRAVMFYESTPNSEVELMDLVNASVNGLISGIDKFCGPYSKVFRSVCIGRMSGNMVDLYSDTSLHFYPSDKKILYKANILRHRKNLQTVEEVCRVLNEEFGNDAKNKKKRYEPVSLHRLQNLLNAQSTVSADASRDEESVNVYSYTPDPSKNAEEYAIETDTIRALSDACEKLDIIEKKVLKLKGVPL